jgi:hypothetical protein
MLYRYAILVEYKHRRRGLSVGLASAASQRKKRADDDHDT